MFTTETLQSLSVRRLAKALLIALAAALPLAFYWGLNDSFDLAKITLFYAGVLPLAGLWIAGGIQGSPAGRMASLKWTVRRSALDRPVLVFMAVYALAAAFSWDLRVSFWGQYRSYVFGLFPVACGALLYWLTAQFHDAGLRRGLVMAALASGGIAAAYGGLQYFGVEFTRMPRHLHERVWSSFGNPIYFGGYLAMVTPLAVHELIESRDWARRGAYAALIFLLLSGLALSLSRGAWLGLAAGLAVYAAAARRVFKPRGSAWVLGGLALSAAFLFLALPPARSRLISIARPEGADWARVEGWKLSARIALQHPILGTGPDTFIYAFRRHRSLEYMKATGTHATHTHAHNDLLQFASTAGLLGLAAYLRLWVSLGKLGWAARNPRALPLLAGLAALFVQNQFNFWSPATMALFWIFLGMLAAEAGPLEEREIEIAEPGPARALAGGSALALLVAGWWILRPAVADFHFMRAQGLLAASQYEAGVRELEQAIRKNRGAATYYDRLSNVFRGLVMMDTAQEVRHLLLNNAVVVTREAAAMMPENPDCRNNLGVALMWATQMAGADKREQAKEAFQSAVEMDPNFVDAWANLAKVSHFEGDFTQESALWRKVLEIDPGNEEANRLLPALQAALGTGGTR